MADFTLEPIEEKTFGFTLEPVIDQDAPTYQNPLQLPPRVSVAEELSMPWKTDKPLTRDDIINNPQYMSIVRNAMRARFGVENRMGVALDYSYEETYSDEELFEMWQNYNRSFAAGQSVTTGAEVAFHQRATEEDKKTVGQSYLLFDNMANIFADETSWREMGEGMFDYARAAIWDPTTALGMGVGKVYGLAGTKATATAIREASKQSFKTAMLRGATKEAAKAEAKKTARIAFAKQAAVDSGKLAAVDLPFAIGADIGYQYSRLESGAQEKWSKLQTGLSAVGAMTLPAIVGSFRGIKAIGEMKGADKLGVQNYVKITEELKGQMSPEKFKAALLKNIDNDIIQSEMGVLAADMDRVMKNMGTNWSDDLAATTPRNLSIDDQKQIFWDTFFFGDTDLGVKGLMATLYDAGVAVPNDVMPTDFLGDVIKELPKEHFKNISKALGDNPDLMPSGFKTMSTEEIGQHFKKMTSNAGRTLARMSVARRRLSSKKPVTVDEVMSGIGYSTVKEQAPERLRYAQSVYKRLLTSHPGTTAVNVKGWSITTSANTVSDLVSGVILGAAGDFRGARGSILGAMRRGANVINHLDTMEAAADYFGARPEVREKVMQFIAGGVDSAGSRKEMFERFGLDPDSTLNNRTESLADFFQMVSGVKIQDEATKMISFMSAIDQELMKTTGQSFNTFMRQPDAWLKMHSREFRRIEQKAIERTLRESYSAPTRATSRVNDIFTSFAEFIEDFSHAPGFGVVVPFGQYFNNATATLGDYTLMNFFRYAASVGGKNTDIDSDDLAQLLAKGAVGWTALTAYFIPHEKEKMDMGLRWNQEPKDDGSISDETYDAPIPYMRVLGRIFAHVQKDGEIPPEMWTEARRIITGQLTRDLSEAGEGINDAAKEFLTSLSDENGQPLMELVKFLSNAASRPVSGALRPLDPVNQIAAMVTNSFENPDRRQGIEALNNSFRYIDQVFDVSTSEEERYRPLNRAAPQDINRLTGNRQAQPPSTSERMLASMGKSPWNAVKWDGDNPQLKNALDKTIEPIINNYADRVLERHPDWFSKSLAAREKIWREDVLQPAKEDTRSLIESELLVDPILAKHLTINSYDRREIDRAIDFWNIKGNLSDLNDTQLGLIIEYLQNPDQYIK